MDKLLFSLIGECHNGPSRGVRMLDIFERENSSVYFKCRSCNHIIEISNLDKIKEIIKHK